MALLKSRSKRYAENISTDTELQMEERKIQLQNKWKKDLLEEKIIQKKGRSHDRKIIKINENIEVQEQCVCCSKWKSLYDFRLSPNFLVLESSKEWIHNPCRECRNILQTDKKRQNPEEYITYILYNYPKLSKEWFQQQIDKNGGLFSSISGIPIYSISCGSWQVSIQNNKRELEHLPEYCEIIALEENIAQHDAIPDLKLAYTELYTAMLKQMIEPDTTEELILHSKIWEDKYTLTPRQSGIDLKSRDINGKISREYDRELQQKHLKSMFTCATKAVYNHDKISKRSPPKLEERLKASDMFNIGKKQNWRCFKSGVKLSINRNSWNYPSLERLDNKLNHTIENTVLICRILNTTDRAQWTSEKLNYALKHQKLVEIPYHIKNKL